MVVTPTGDLATEIQRLTGENLYLCYQCKKCTAGCPVAVYFDLAPHQFVRALQFGQKDLVLNSRTLWLCTQCEACVTRCPQDIGIPAIVDELRIMARREGIKPKVQAVPMFYDAALRGIKLFGRMFEAGLMGELYTRLMLTGKMDYKQLLAKDMPMALKLVRDGKLAILPSLAHYPKRRKKPAQRVVDPASIAYYPGCSLHGTSKEYDISVRAAMGKMGVDLDEPEGWVCCGTTPAHSTDHVLSTIMPLKNASLIEDSGHSYVTVPCPSCYIRLRTAIRDIRQDPELQREVAARAPSLAPSRDTGRVDDAADGAEPPELAHSYVPRSDMTVDHLLTTITDHIGYEKVAQAVTTPLQGLKVVCYYGCVITRPPKLTGIENYEYPMNMDRLMETCGAESLDWSYKTECCGVSLGITQLPIALGMTEKVLRDAKASGAEAVVVACPLCHVNLDSRQKQIEEEFAETFDLPVFYLTQLMGLAFGVASEDLGLEKHFVDPFPLLRAKGLG
jgi:heterodisulfide reductase subunit B